jgi:hypothetical protein
MPLPELRTRGKNCANPKCQNASKGSYIRFVDEHINEAKKGAKAKHELRQIDANLCPKCANSIFKIIITVLSKKGCKFTALGGSQHTTDSEDKNADYWDEYEKLQNYEEEDRNSEDYDDVFIGLKEFRPQR